MSDFARISFKMSQITAASFFVSPDVDGMSGSRLISAGSHPSSSASTLFYLSTIDSDICLRFLVEGAVDAGMSGLIRPRGASCGSIRRPLSILDL